MRIATNASPFDDQPALKSSVFRRVLPFLLIIFLTGTIAALFGQEPVILQTDTHSVSIGKSSSYLLDTGQALGIGEVSDISVDPAFIPSGDEILNFGYSSAAIWVRFTIRDMESGKRWCLKIDNFDDVRVYFPEPDNHWREIVLGRKNPASNIPKRGGYYFLDIPSGTGERTIYLRYVHEDTLVIHLSIVDLQTSLIMGGEDFITTLYIGIIGVMVLYNLLLFLLLRDSSYVYYALYILNMLLLQLELAGVFLNVLGPGSLLTTDMLETLVIALALGSYIMFVRKFLLGKKMSPRIDKMLLVLFFILLAHIPTVFFVPFLARTLSLSLGLLGTLVLIWFLVIVCVRRGYAPVRFYIAAWFVLAASMVTFLLRNFNLVPNVFVTEFSMQIGTSIEAVLLAFGLAFRINLLQKEREQAYEESLASERKAKKMESDYQMLFETAPLGIALFNLSGEYLAVNQSYCDMYDRRGEDLKGVSFIETVYQEERRKAEKTFWDNLIAGAAPGIISFERTNLTGSGKRILVRYFCNFTRNEKGELSGMLACVEDITDLKRLLNDLKNSLNEKDLLLKEVHHRVKNNLQIIISLFRVKSREVNDPGINAILDSTAGRIRAIANLHNRIYLSHDVAHVEAKAFIESTVKQSLSAFHIPDGRFDLRYDITPSELPVDIALPLSLIINELTSNSVKHGFQENKKLCLSVYFQEKTKKAAETGRNFNLVIEDDGKGLPQDFSMENIDTFGLALVESLVSQLSGSFQLDKHPTTRFSISFSCR